MTRHPDLVVADAVLDALTALRDHGLVTDRAELNRAWAELTGRAAPAAPPGIRCSRCGGPGIRWHEPFGEWCPGCRPRLWREQAGSPWATPRCQVCGAPAGYPAGARTPCCRAHAPRKTRRYLDRRVPCPEPL